MASSIPNDIDHVDDDLDIDYSDIYEKWVNAPFRVLCTHSYYVAIADTKLRLKKV
jgi:hypothetical protein